jgi:transposase InsO family protein
MPWKEQTLMSQRKAFIQQAIQAERNMSQLCREFGISRKTGYKWLKRYLEMGEEGLKDQSRRPRHSPRRTPRVIEEKVLRMRRQYPVWGGRKLNTHLKDLGYQDIPSPSTITAILHRHEFVQPEESVKRQKVIRFEKAKSNQMLQMDFKAPYSVNGTECTILTILDDYSRYLLCLKACVNQRRETVQEHLTSTFQRFGLPETILTDNGPPWGPANENHYYTKLTIWLMRLGIRSIRSRPYHPQTLGKDERLHRTLQEEVLNLRSFSSVSELQNRLEEWQHIYNTQRPHDALDLKTPHTRYRASPRPFPDELPPIEYPKNYEIRKVSLSGTISFRDRNYKVGKAFANFPVGVIPSPTQEDGMDVYFCKQLIKIITLSDVEC